MNPLFFATASLSELCQHEFFPLIEKSVNYSFLVHYHKAHGSLFLVHILSWYIVIKTLTDNKQIERGANECSLCPLFCILTSGQNHHISYILNKIINPSPWGAGCSPWKLACGCKPLQERRPGFSSSFWNWNWGMPKFFVIYNFCFVCSENKVCIFLE